MSSVGAEALGPVVRSALGGGELLCGDVDLCWLPEVQTGCHQVVKPRAKGIKTGEEKLAQQQEAHKTEKVEKNHTEGGQEQGAEGAQSQKQPEGMALRRLDERLNRDLMGSLCNQVQVDTAKVRETWGWEVAQAAGLWVHRKDVCQPYLTL